MSEPSDCKECRVLRELREAEGLFEALREARGSELQVQERLRAEFPDELVRAAITLEELRRKGAEKFSRAERMWFTRKGLEQATSDAVSRHKAGRFSGHVWDYCAGIGGDAIALALAGCCVTAVDRDAANCLRVEWNAEAYVVRDLIETRVADVETLVERDGLLHVDPDRRNSGGRRTVRIEDGSPGLEFLRRVIGEFEGGAIKLSPAANFTGKFAGAEIELVSWNGEAREATVWFGRLATPGQWRATTLPSGETLAGDPLESYAEMGPLGSWIYDPDAALVRAGLVNLLCERAGLTRLDDAGEYLTSENLVESPFVQPFEVIAELPNNDREIRRFFRESVFGQVEIKCRHIPVQAEAVRRKLPLPGHEPGVLMFARIGGKARAVVCRRPQ
jgi:hypothetical protein